jgi:hypothetical protein
MNDEDFLLKDIFDWKPSKRAKRDKIITDQMEKVIKGLADATKKIAMNIIDKRNWLFCNRSVRGKIIGKVHFSKRR